jgi:uncharacterized repeat protein (TIGR03803 family)
MTARSYVQKMLLQIAPQQKALALILASVAITVGSMGPAAQAQTLTVLYSFKGGTDGYGPYAGLVRDPAGNLYGTTNSGGDLSCAEGTGCGTIFRISPSGKKIAYSFQGSSAGDGSGPWGALIRDSQGNLYGTTNYGGKPRVCINGTSGCGTVFKVDPKGKVTILYSFTGGLDGGYPIGSLLRDASGNLYGTTEEGGPNNSACQYGCGVVFKLDPAGNETVLHSFDNQDGALPFGGLVADSAGNLYGTTSQGGDLNCFDFQGCGTVFKLNATGNNFKTLYTFIGPLTDGNYSFAGTLWLDSAGNLYGTTYYGGDSEFCGGGCGSVFGISAAGKESLVSFGGPDGAGPIAGLISDGKGNFYGTTQLGGSVCDGVTVGCGTVFQTNAKGIQVLHNFSGIPDGAEPYGGLTRDAAGILYGTTSAGGAYGYGTVFKLTP